MFTELARQAGRLWKHPALPGWLFTTTRRIASTALRAERRRRWREHLFISKQPAHDATDPDHDEGDWHQIASVLDEVLHEVNERDRTAIVLRFFQSRPLADVGQALGLTANAARMRVDRALDRLRQRLARRGVHSTAVALGAAMAANAVQVAPAGLPAMITATAVSAVAATTVSVASTSVFTTMITLKSKLIMGGLAVSLVAVPLLLQREEIHRLGRDLAQATEAQQALAQSEAEARRSAELASAENAQLRESRTELLRLRGEIGPLRDQLRTLTRAAPAAVGQPVRAAEPQPSKAEPADLGATTAEHAASSLIWAVSKGRLDRLSDLLELPSSVTPDDAPRHFAFFANQLSNVFHGLEFNGWKMDLKGTTNEDIVRLHYGYHDPESSKDDAFAFYLHRADAGWEVMVEGEVPADF